MKWVKVTAILNRSNWGALVFYLTLIVLLAFFWWLLIYSGGVTIHHS